MVALSRRDFCRFTAIGIAAAGCGGGPSAVETGPLGGGDDDVGPDAKLPPDAAMPPDSSTAAMCMNGETDVGLATSFAVNTPVYVSALRMFVVRDANGLYALTARCTHEGVVCSVSGQNFRCPRHGALFTFTGSIVSGPVNKALAHYAMCSLPGGHVGINTSTVVSASTRLDV